MMVSVFWAILFSLKKIIKTRRKMICTLILFKSELRYLEVKVFNYLNTSNKLYKQKNKMIYFLPFFLFSLASCVRYSSIAIVIEGADLVGAGIVSFNPASFTAFAVVGPKAAIKLLF